MLTTKLFLVDAVADWRTLNVSYFVISEMSKHEVRVKQRCEKLFEMKTFCRTLSVVYSGCKRASPSAGNMKAEWSKVKFLFYPFKLSTSVIKHGFKILAGKVKSTCLLCLGIFTHCCFRNTTLTVLFNSIGYPYSFLRHMQCDGPPGPNLNKYQRSAVGRPETGDGSQTSNLKKHQTILVLLGKMYTLQ